MPRPRALLAILATIAWCAAAWHVDLEAVGLMLEHQHHAHAPGGHAHDDAPGGAPDAHAPVMVRDVVKDEELRIGPAALLSFAFVGLLLACAIPPGRAPGERDPVPIGGRPAPPFERVWQFVQRCAPESVAPPALG